MSRPIWGKSSRSITQGGACVEVASLSEAIGVRDSKNPDAGNLTISPEVFDALVRRIRQGELNA